MLKGRYYGLVAKMLDWVLFIVITDLFRDCKQVTSHFCACFPISEMERILFLHFKMH